MLTVAIDLRPLVGSPKTGIGEYADQLTHALIHTGKFRIILFSNSVRRRPPYPYRGDFGAVFTTYPNKVIDLTIRALGRPYLDDLIAKASGETIDVLLSPHITSAPVRRSAKIVVVHDCSFRYHEFFSFRKRYWHWSMHAARTIEQARRIVAVSAHTREELCRYFPLSDNRLSVVTPGLDPQFLTPPEPAQQEEVRKQYHLPQRFILFLGTIEPRKNIVAILEAYKRLALSCSEDLVIAGRFGWKTHSIKQAIRRHVWAHRIHLINYVRAEDKNTLYRLARVFVYPSFYEGFGFPPLEALACGVPVIVSHATSLPEVVGCHALTIDPYDSKDVERAISTALTDERYRAWAAIQGPRAAAQFSWEKTAEGIAEVIENTARSGAIN